MSVVNRMLQDIDQRAVATAFDALGPAPDVRSVPSRGPGAQRKPWLAGAFVTLVAVGALAAWGWIEGRSGTSERSTAAAPVPAAVPPVVPTAVSAEVPAVLPVQMPPPVVAAKSVPAPVPPQLVEERPPIDVFRLSLTLSTPAAHTRPASVPKVPPMATAPQAEVARPFSTSKPVVAVPQAAPAKKVATPVVAVPQVAPAKTVAAPVVAVRHVAAAETVGAARQLWDEGSRANALATLRDAITAAEASRDFQVARLLTLELARFELAGNRPQAALELLRRQAGQYGEDADALALRGNAQQRLALHAEAAESYLAALRLRPTEGRWMLGAAISLAADGRPDEARPWVERARDQGAITPPIAAYLQQLGVGPRP